MYIPLVVLSVFAVGAAWKPVYGLGGAFLTLAVYLIVRLKNPRATTETEGLQRLLGIMATAFVAGAVVTIPFSGLYLENLLEQARPLGISADQVGVYTSMVWRPEHLSHAADFVQNATLIASGTTLAGVLLAVAFYGLRQLDPADVRRQFAPVHSFLVHKWYFDELYQWLFVNPTHWIARSITFVDQKWIDGLIHFVAAATKWFATFWDRVADRTIVDGSVNVLARWALGLGLSLRAVQTGRLRQYVMFIVLGTVVAFLVLSVFWNYSLAR